MKKLVQFLNRYTIPLVALSMYLAAVVLHVLAAIYEKHDVGLAVFTASLGVAGLLVLYKLFWTALRTLHQNQNN